MPPDASDEELLAAFQQGDAGAFERLLRRHRGPLFTFLLRMLGDRERAEDLAQETFLRVVKGAADWRERAKFKTWLYAIARNLCFDHARRDKFRRTDSLDGSAEGADGEEGQSLAETIASPDAGPDRAAANAQLKPMLIRALQALPDEQREVFILREQSGLAFKEIAELQGVNENTVKSRMRYALEGLRAQLEQSGVTAALAHDVDVAGGPAGSTGGRARESAGSK
jgi:RNA polymerase sigma-70 factor (ECF subfamily)